jgi:glutathione S-transferase
MHYAEGTMMPLLVLKLIFDRMDKPPVPFFIRPVARGIAGKVKSSYVQPNLDRNLDFMEAELARSEWFAGSEFSAADVQMSFPLEVAAVRGGLDARLPKLTDWLARIHARPSYQQALKRGGVYSILR